MRAKPWQRRSRREAATAGVAVLGLTLVRATRGSVGQAFAADRLLGQPVARQVHASWPGARRRGCSDLGLGRGDLRSATSSRHQAFQRGRCRPGSRGVEQRRPADAAHWHSNRLQRDAAYRLATAEGEGSPAHQQPWTQRDWFPQTFQWVLISNIVVSGAVAASWIGPSLAFALDRVFVGLFLLELACRLQAEGPRTYFGSKLNWFDFAFVTVYAIDVVLSRLGGWGVTSAIGMARIGAGLRVTRSSLRLYKLIENVPRFSSALVRFTGVALFVALSAELKVLAIQSVVGMLGIFAGLVALSSWISPSASDAVYKAVEPGKAFLVKWATLFFAPALARLPCVQENFETGVLIRLAVLLVGGFLGTLLSTAGIASLFPEAAAEDPPLAEEKAKPAPAAKDEPKGKAADVRPYKKRLLLGYAAIMAVSVLFARCRSMPTIAQNGFMLGSSLLGFVAGMLSPKRVQSFVHPMFVCILTTWLGAAAWGGVAGLGGGFLSTLDAYSTWPGAGAVLSFMLGPTVVALGVLLYERRRLLLRELSPMIATSVLTALVSLFFTAFLARALGLPSQLALASLLRCISSPFAGDLTGLIGASPTFAIAMIVVTGFIGVVLGQPIFNALGIRSARTRGLAMGAAAHGLGTVALAQSDPDAFPYSALSFLLVGTATTALVQVPPLRAALLSIVLG